MPAEQNAEMPRSLMVGLICLLVGFAGYCAGLVSGYYGTFPIPELRLHFGRPQPRDLPGFVARGPQFSYINGRADVVMVGDSQTANVQWHEVFPTVQIVNRGIPYDTTETLLTRIDEVNALNPKTVFLLIGVNDLLHGKSMAALVANYGQLLDRVSGRRVVVQSIIRVAGNDDVNRRCDLVNAALKKLCARRGVEFLDLNAVLAPGGSLPGPLTDDGLHLNVRGIKAWADIIRSHLGGEPAPAR